MNTEKKEQAIQTLENELIKLKNKENKICFFILDTKGTPSGSLSYIYEMALSLHENGYNIQMLHQEKEFVGVEEWLGEKYGKLPHANIETDNVDISASDMLIIPEIFSNVMTQTKNLPCKRIVLLQNFNYLTEFIPIGATWEDMRILDVIVNSKIQEEMIKEVFPNIRTHIISPSIPNYFQPGIKPKELIINIVARNQSDINKIVKPFYWKYPVYKWVSFRDLRGLPRQQFAEAMRESAITIWVDDDSNFGYSPLEAIKSGSIVIGKIPEIIPDWMTNENGEFNNSCFLVNDMRSIHKLIASVIKAWTYDEIPQEIYDDMKKLEAMYTLETQKNDTLTLYNNLIEEREKEITILLNEIKKIKD